MSDMQLNSPGRENHAPLYEVIRTILLAARRNAYQAVNSAMVVAYWSIGKAIVEDEQQGNARGEYGGKILEQLSTKLQAEFGGGFTVRNLHFMKKLYLTYPIVNALRSQLSWTHYKYLMRVENAQARAWYEEETIRNQWSSRQLDRQISTLYYERLLTSRDSAPLVEEAEEKLQAVQPQEFIKDPYVLEFLNVQPYPALRENTLEQALIDNLQHFLLELGRGFCFVARQKLMRFDDDDFYLDLVFYHSILKCYVLIDLKVGRLTHADVGQMDSYIRMFDALYKNSDDNPTIGLILCSEKNEAVVRYSVLNDGKQIFASRYQFSLPSPEELQRRIIAERRRLEDNL